MSKRSLLTITDVVNYNYNYYITLLYTIQNIIDKLNEIFAHLFRLILRYSVA